MSDHLPECIYEPEHWDVEQSILWGGKPCICDRLRACEQRLALQWLVTDREAQEREERAYKAGLAAARDAVANLPVAITVVHDTPFLNKQGMGVCENPDKYPHGIVQVAALAAIDALRGTDG